MEVGLFDLTQRERRDGDEKVDRNYASIATSVASSGELPRLGRQLVRFRTLCRRNRSPLYEESFAGPARGRNRIIVSSPRST